MSTAPAQAWWRDTAGLGWSAAAGQVALAAVALAAIALAAPVFGLVLPAGGVAILAAGAVATARWPHHAVPLSVVAGAALLVLLHPAYAAYHVLLIGTLYAFRRRAPAVLVGLLALAVVVPKALFALFYGRPILHAWLNAPSLAVAIFVTVFWWRESRDRRLPSEPPTPARWALLYLFPFHAVYPVAFAPSDLWRPRRVDTALVLRGAALALGKAAALALLQRLFPNQTLADWPGEALSRLPALSLWGVVGLSYLELVLMLSGVAEVAIVVARLYGWALPSPFRFALLAWNPVELWRRWGIYTRRFLLKTVYFPLGGSARHRLLNVMLTFLASALVLHSGWLGSKYWQVGVAGWRDHAIYFGLQGLAVCGCLVLWQWAGKDPALDRALRWSWGRVAATIATQGMSAWVHVVILAQSVPLAGRFRLMARCLGFEAGL